MSTIEQRIALEAKIKEIEPAYIEAIRKRKELDEAQAHIYQTYYKAVEEFNKAVFEPDTVPSQVDGL